MPQSFMTLISFRRRWFFVVVARYATRGSQSANTRKD
jgi:hypothetical protein